MLRPDDAAVVRRDPVLPGLALLLDAELLLAVLNEMRGEGDVVDVTVEYLRYKPGQSCLAACRATRNGREVLFSAKAHRPDATDKLAKAFTKRAAPTALGAGRFMLPGGVIVSVFPNDTNLTTLARLNPTDLHARLRGAHTHHAFHQEAEIHPLRYNPERRFVGRLTANGASVAVVRCYAQADFEATAAKAGQLKSRGSLQLARRLALVPRLRLVAFEWLEGELLDDAITHQGVTHETMRAVGTALAELHAQDAAALPPRSPRSEIAGLRATAHHLGRIHPEVAEQARHLAKRIGARIGGASYLPRSIHGDFYTKQILLRTDGIAFLDLDDAAWGDPAVDLARLCADLERAVISGTIRADRATAHTEAFFEGYRRATGAALPAHLNTEIASQMMRLAPHPFRRREVDWVDATARILDRAGAYLNAGAPAAHRGSRTFESVTDSLGALGDASMPFVAEALNPVAMSTRLRREMGCLDAARDGKIRSISVLRHKPGRRCLIEYGLEPERRGDGSEVMLIGKVRARGTDLATHAVLQQLWRGAFGPGATDSIFVPEPLCVLPDLHMTVQRKVPGETLWSLLEGSQGVRVARRAAEAIDKLHRVGIPAHRHHSIETELSILQDRLGAVADEHPLWSDRLDTLCEQSKRAARSIRFATACAIHRDFYPDQLLSDGERFWLIDLDLFTAGNPAIDVGNFAAHLDEYALRRFGSVGVWEDRRQAFIERYLELSTRTTREAIELCATLSVARHVWISTLFAERTAYTEKLLALAEERFLGHVRDTDPAMMTADRGRA